jgi:signal transduction histidine kinase
MKLILIMSSLILGIICIILVCNIAFLSKFYTASKVSSLGTSYNQVNEVYDSQEAEQKMETLGETQALELERLSANRSMSLYVFDVSFSLNIGSLGVAGVSPEISYSYPKYYTDQETRELISCVKRYITNAEETYNNKEQSELLKRGEKYNIYRVYNERIQSYYIELFGTLDNDSYIYIRTNFESMKESVNISNRFLIYVGLCVLVLAVLIMWVVGGSFTRPILELADIAKRISNLDFTARYTGRSKDEIGVLGDSINQLAEQLESNIQELKTANNELKLDIENKIQIDEMRKEFLSNVSHELKTPIALIQGYAEGLLDNISEDKESRDFYCEVIVDEANKMNKMVKKLLSLNQIEFGGYQVAMEHFDITAVIRSVLSSTEILAEQKEAKITFEEDGPVFVWADEYMIEEVVTNYVSNALNHVDGEKQISVKIIQKEDVARICVFNTGACIPEEDIEKIWIKFYKVDKARTREYGGSGIGLSIVSAIMAAHNRACGVINRENGVEFWFEVDTKN